MAAEAAGMALLVPLRSRWLAAACGCAVVWLVMLFFTPEAALRGWLAGFFFAGGATLGALVLSAMMRLIPGLWDRELRPLSDALAALVPAAALAFLPVLVGAAWLYPWEGSEGKGAFREAWMTLPFWTIRAALFLLVASAFSFLLRNRTQTTLLPAGGLILLVALFMPVSVDWFLFLDPEAHFSGFALPALANFFLGALCVSILLAAASSTRIERPELLGSLLIAALLAWAYFSFTQYFITWSDNLPFGVRWYAARGQGGWHLTELALAGLRLVPLFLLLFPPVRGGERWLAAIAAAVLAGNGLEALWLIVPAPGTAAGAGAAAVLPALLSAAGLGLLGVALLVSPAGRGGVQL